RQAGPRAAAAEGAVSVGQRRPGQDLADGSVLPEPAVPRAPPPPLPPLHVRSPRAAAHAAEPGSTARDPRAAHRGGLPGAVLRRVLRLGHRRRDDPRGTAGGAVQPWRDTGGDLEYAAQGPLQGGS